MSVTGWIVVVIVIVLMALALTGNLGFTIGGGDQASLVGFGLLNILGRENPKDHIHA